MDDRKNNSDPAQDAPSILIKKYPNRRLYNTATSSYIVLEDVVELVKSGTEFTIEDTKTGEDLTRSILNQIIYERETAQVDYHFPLDVQKQLILMYDDAYGKMVPEYLRESMNLFVNERDKMKSTFEDIVSHNSKTMAKFGEQIAEQNLEFFNKTFEFFQSMSGMPTSANKSTTSDDSAAAEKKSKLEDIQAQIDALQKQLKSID